VASGEGYQMKLKQTQNGNWKLTLTLEQLLHLKDIVNASECIAEVEDTSWEIYTLINDERPYG
jgi:hypothetical protein